MSFFRQRFAHQRKTKSKIYENILFALIFQSSFQFFETIFSGTNSSLWYQVRATLSRCAPLVLKCRLLFDLESNLKKMQINGKIIFFSFAFSEVQYCSTLGISNQFFVSFYEKPLIYMPILAKDKKYVFFFPLHYAFSLHSTL